MVAPGAYFGAGPHVSLPRRGNLGGQIAAGFCAGLATGARACARVGEGNGPDVLGALAICHVAKYGNIDPDLVLLQIRSTS